MLGPGSFPAPNLPRHHLRWTEIRLRTSGRQGEEGEGAERERGEGERGEGDGKEEGGREGEGKEGEGKGDGEAFEDEDED